MQMNEDMRGLFFIVRGQYRRDKGVKFFNEVSGTYNNIGGYDPTDDTNEEWYMLNDCETFTTIACGTSIERLLRCAENYIKEYKTKSNYLKMMRSLEYGNNTSPIHVRLQKEIYEYYGDHYRDLIEEVEDRAYEYLADQTPQKKVKKIKSNLNRNRLSSTPKDKGASIIKKKTLPQPKRKLLKKTI